MIVSATNIRVNNVISTTVRITDGYPSIGWTYSPINRVVTDESLVGTIDSVTTSPQYSFEIQIGTTLGGSDISATGAVISSANDWRIRGPELVRGTLYYGMIRVTDSLGNTSDWSNFQFYYNSLPSVSEQVITPSSPSVNDNLVLSYDFHDPDGDIESGSLIWWYKNGVHQKNLDGLTTINSSYLSYNDTWMAQIVPNDGYKFGASASTSAVTVTTTVPVVSDAVILPANPTFQDPLYASYSFSSADNIDQSQIKWYINGSLVAGVNTAFARLPTQAGDSVYFEIQPSDGISYGSWVASPAVTISIPPYRVVNLRIENETEPLSVISPTPTLSWEIAGPDFNPTTTSVLIGTAPNASNVGSFTINSSNNSFTIPSGLLQPGGDYFASVAIGTSQLGDYSTVHFRTNGSRWANSVNNSTGWTIETSFSTTPGTSSSSSGGTVPAQYQGIRIFDGTKSAEVRFYTSSVVLISNQTLSASADMSTFPVITITGQGSNIKVFYNYTLLIDGTGYLTATTTDKLIEFGSLSGSTLGYYRNFNYTTLGAFEPTSTQYNNFDFQTFYETDGNVDYLTAASGLLYFSASDSNSSSTVYQVEDYLAPVSFTAASNAFINVNGITTNGDKTYICHNKGTTIIQGRVISSYSASLDFTVSNDPENFDWILFATSYTSASFVSGGLNIVSNSGKYYYSQALPGTPWFDTISNTDGWTVDFNLAVSSVSNENTASNTSSPDGAGIYVNDGSFYESIFFFPDSIRFATSGVTVSQNNSSATNYRLTGQGGLLSLYNGQTLLAQSPFVYQATSEGNGGRPAIYEDSTGVQHCVWHDDGSSGRTRVFYSKGLTINGEVVWSNPELIADQPVSSSDPDVAVDAFGTVYIVYEADQSDIWMVVRNAQGLSNPFLLNSGGYIARNPRIAVDANNNAHVVWSDSRNGVPQIFYGLRDYTTGSWIFQQLTNASFSATRPSVDVDENSVFVGYTQYKDSDYSDIYLMVFNGSWYAPALVSSGNSHADCTDVVANNGVLYVVWHSDQSGNYEVYGRRFSYASSAIDDISQISSGLESSRFPTIGSYLGFGAQHRFSYVIWEEGSDLAPTSALENYTPVIPNLRGAYFDAILNEWKSTNLNSGSDITFSSGDTRAFRRPRIAKHFIANANVVYEAEMVDFSDEYIPVTDEFCLINCVSYPVSSSSVTVSGIYDLQVSGQLSRKEIRFGDFSSVISTNQTWGNIKYLTGEAIEPLSMAVISNLAEQNCYNSVVNSNGDGWIASDSGLLFYFKSLAELAYVYPDATTAVTVDRNGVLLIGVSGKIYLSYDRVNFVLLNIAVDPAPVSINSMATDSANNLWVATDQGIIQIPLTQFTSLTDLAYGTLTVNTYTLFNITTGLPDNNITKVVVDGNDVIWAASNSGLISISNGNITIYDITTSAIPSNSVNDIAIKNSAARYIATSGGLAEMTGEFRLITVDETLWTDNVQSVGWSNPNVIWAAGGGNLFQILTDDSGQVSSVTTFQPYDYTLVSPTDCDRPRVYKFDGFDATCVTDVYVNGRKVNQGYALSSLESAVIFDSPLNTTDVVTVTVRKDISQLGTLTQNKAEQIAYGLQNRHISKFLTDGTSIWATTTGDNNQLVVYSGSDNFTMPYNKIVLDTTPPTGSLAFIEQIDRSHVEFAVTASDNLSGVGGMILSNFPNFTTDGTTPQSFVPYTPTVIFDLGTSLDNQSDQIVFSGYVGSCLSQFNGTTYAGTASPAKILQYGANNNLWSEVVTLDASDSTSAVEFMIMFQNVLVVGTSSSTTSGKIYISSDGVTFTLLSTITGTGATCAAILNSVLYIGTVGSGYLYTYDGNTLAVITTSNSELAPPLPFGSGIYSITAANGLLYIGTGSEAMLYTLDPITLTAMIVYSANDTVISAVAPLLLNSDGSTTSVNNPSAAVSGSELVIFAGTETLGQVVKSIAGSAYVVSYAGLPMTVAQLKIYNNTVFAAIGQTLYRYDSGWIARYTHTEDILDFIVGPDITADSTTDIPRNDITVISASKITFILGEIDTKMVYLSLQDVAGNATRLPGTSSGGATGTLISEPLSIDSLTNFINVDRILELDEYGQTVFHYDGSDSFYSADEVLQETGTYVSEVFNGGSDQVAWDTIYWDAEVPDGTDLNIYVRTSNFRTTINLADWSISFTKDQFEGVDISNLSGTFIQFKVVLSTTIRDLSPKLYRVVIGTINRASIHFFTTNFVLPSPLVNGILTADTFLPVSADVVFGIDTNDSTNFNDYQVVEPNQMFTTDPTQIGTNLRVGIKLISPLPASTVTDALITNDEYGDPVYSNIVDFTYTNTLGSTAAFNFKVEFYDDDARTQLETTLYSISDPTAWSYNETAFPSSGLTLTNGSSAEIFAAGKGNAALMCGKIYYVSVYTDKGTNGETYTLLSDTYAFEIPCNPTFIDYVNFDVTNTTGSTAYFNFRVRVYSDATRTDLVETYYSGLSQEGWLVNGNPITPPGASLTNGEMVSVSFEPPQGDLDGTTTYSLIVDYISGSDFVTNSNYYTLRINSTSDFGCSEYVNVPVVKNIGIMFDLSQYTDEFGKQRTTVLLNI